MQTVANPSPEDVRAKVESNLRNVRTIGISLLLLYVDFIVIAYFSGVKVLWSMLVLVVVSAFLLGGTGACFFLYGLVRSSAGSPASETPPPQVQSPPLAAGTYDLSWAVGEYLRFNKRAMHFFILFGVGVLGFGLILVAVSLYQWNGINFTVGIIVGFAGVALAAMAANPVEYPRRLEITEEGLKFTKSSGERYDLPWSLLPSGIQLEDMGRGPEKIGVWPYKIHGWAFGRAFYYPISKEAYEAIKGESVKHKLVFSWSPDFNSEGAIDGGKGKWDVERS